MDTQQKMNSQYTEFRGLSNNPLFIQKSVHFFVNSNKFLIFVIMIKTTNTIPYIPTALAIKGYSDSKLAQSERGDCVVRAIASAYDMTYDKAHGWVADTFARKPKRGTWGFPTGMNTMSDNKTRLNHKMTKTIDSATLTTRGGRSKMTVGTFAKLYNRGTYIIRVTHHVFTIKDGQVIGNSNDALQLRKVIKNAWKIG